MFKNQSKIHKTVKKASALSAAMLIATSIVAYNQSAQASFEVNESEIIFLSVFFIA